MTSFYDKINNVWKSVKSPCLTFNFSFFWFLRLEVQPTSISDVCVLRFLSSSFFWPNISQCFWPSSDSSPFFFHVNFFKLLRILKRCHYCLAFCQFLAFPMHQSKFYPKFSLFSKWPILVLIELCGPLTIQDVMINNCVIWATLCQRSAVIQNWLDILAWKGLSS